MEDSGKHHQIGQRTKSVLDPTGHLYNNKWGKEIYRDSYSSATNSPQKYQHKKYKHTLSIEQP